MKRQRVLVWAYVVIFSAITVVGCKKDDDSDITDPPNTANSANQQPLGTSANDLLSSDNFTSLRLEIAYPDGFRPTQETIDLIDDFLEARLDKPDGITIVESVINPSQTPPYTINEIVAIEDEHRTVFNQGDEIGVYVFFS